MDMYNRIFIFSSEQKKQKAAIALNDGHTYIPGTVIVNGRPKQYTDMIISMSNCMFGDAIVVAKGDMRNFTITEPRWS